MQIIDMAVPSDRKTYIKVVNKVSKCKDLEIEIARMWKTGTEMIPVVIGALGVIKKRLEKCVDKIPGTVSIDELQKITLLGTAHILRTFLSITLTLWHLRPMVWTWCFGDQTSTAIKKKLIIIKYCFFFCFSYSLCVLWM